MEEDKQPLEPELAAEPSATLNSGDGGGWGGWRFSSLSVLSDLQKVASAAGEGISRNAAVVAKNFSEMQDMDESSDIFKGEEKYKKPAVEENEDEDDKLRKSTLDKLEKASRDSFLSQGLKTLDTSVENIASGAWQALGSAWKGGSNLVQKLEHSAANLAESMQHAPAAAGFVSPSLIESGKSVTAKGMRMLEVVGKETMDLLITETGIEVEKDSKEAGQPTDEDQLCEEVTFDRCFYIYGGPEQIEELEALSRHYALLFNRRKAKLPPEQKLLYDGKLREVQRILNLSVEFDASGVDADKGKKIEAAAEGNSDEIRDFRDSSVSKAADMAAGFANALSGLALTDIIQRTAGRLESLHSEGVHRLSEMCCFAVSQLLMLGKSIMSSANNFQADDGDNGIDWPADCVEKAKIIRMKVHSMTGSVEAVSTSFISGISDVAEAYLAATRSTTGDFPEDQPPALIQDKVQFFSEHLQADRRMAVGKIQEGLQYLSFVVLSTSLPAV